MSKFIRVGKVGYTSVVIFGNFALPTWVLALLPLVAYLGTAVGLCLWDVNGDGNGQGALIFSIMSAVIVLVGVIGLLLFGIVAAIRSVIAVNRGGRIK